MASIKMSEHQCARCERMLAISNTNPNGLCGYCQRGMSKAQIQQWRDAGKPRIGAKALAPRRACKAPKRLPCDLRKLTDAALVALARACRDEVEGRAAGARKLIALLED